MISFMGWKSLIKGKNIILHWYKTCKHWKYLNMEKNLNELCYKLKTERIICDFAISHSKIIMTFSNIEIYRAYHCAEFKVWIGKD